jgi:hypothetical protein
MTNAIPLVATFANGMNDQRLELAATDKTPAVLLDPVTGSMRIAGCSIPENADRFFGPIYDAVDHYAEKPAERTSVKVELTYFNSSTSKYLLDVFKRLEDAHAKGTTNVELVWYHAADDLDMKEAGEDYRSLLRFPVRLSSKRE